MSLSGRLLPLPASATLVYGKNVQRESVICPATMAHLTSNVAVKTHGLGSGACVIEHSHCALVVEKIASEEAIMGWTDFAQ